MNISLNMQSWSHLMSMWLDIFYPNRNTPLTSASKRTLRTATLSVASWKGATGGPGSRISHSAWLFKTAQYQESPVMLSALIASVGRNCENTSATQEKFLNWWCTSHYQLPSPRMPPAVQMQGTLCWHPQNVPCGGMHCWMQLQWHVQLVNNLVNLAGWGAH